MSMLTQSVELPTFVQVKMDEIKAHLGWKGDLTGVEAEAILRNKSDMTYVLRQGERSDHFYLTYVKEGTTFIHIPFTVDHATRQWFYSNYHPHYADTLQIFIPEIMHADEDSCYPLLPLARK